MVRAGVHVASRAGSGDEGGQRDGAARTLDDGSGARSLCAPTAFQIERAGLHAAGTCTRKSSQPVEVGGNGPEGCGERREAL